MSRSHDGERLSDALHFKSLFSSNQCISQPRCDVMEGSNFSLCPPFQFIHGQAALAGNEADESACQRRSRVIAQMFW